MVEVLHQENTSQSRGVGPLCQLCKNYLNGPCSVCQKIQKNNQDPCPCSKCIGLCNHTFHCHCLDPWLKIQNYCPLCFSEWQPVKKYD